jgi:ankyrin repeat protein
MDQPSAAAVIQEALVDLQDDTIDPTVDLIMQSDWVDSPDGIVRLAHNLFEICDIRPHLIPRIVSVISRLLANSHTLNSLGLLKGHLTPPDLDRQRWYRSFLVNCLSQKVVTTEDFVGFITSLPLCPSLYLAFSWFAPYLELAAIDTVRLLWDAMEQERSSGRLVSSEILFFMDRLEELRAAGWAVHRQYFQTGYASRTIPWALRKDDVFTFKSLALMLKCEGGSAPSDPGKLAHLDVEFAVDGVSQSDLLAIADLPGGFDFNQRIEPSLFERSDFVRHRPTLSQCAAFFSASQCFTFLLPRADLSLADDVGATLPMFAVAGGNEEIVRMCFERCPDFAGTGQVAIRFFRFAILDILLTVSDDVQTIERPEFVHYAARFNNIHALRTAIELADSWEGAANGRDRNGQCPLHCAAQFGQLDAMIELMALPGIDVNARNAKGRTPLHLAVKAGQLDAVRVLLACEDVDANAFDETGATPLGLAVQSENCEVLAFLMQWAPVSVNIQSEIGLSPLHISVRCESSEPMERLLAVEGIDVNIRDMSVCF